MSKRGLLLILLIIIITSNLFVLSKPNPQTILRSPLLSLSQILALIGTALLSLSFFLSSRMHLTEKIFGGLDKVYKLHQITGGVAFAMLLNHPLLLIIDRLPNTTVALSYILPSSNPSYSFGVFALWSMAFFIIISIYIALPYDLWKKTHEFMGIPLLLSTIHVLLIPSDTSRYFPLRLWIGALLTFAVFCFIYRRFLITRIGSKYLYKVENVIRDEDLIEISLTPINKQLSFTPGQFAYVSFKDNPVDKQSHPFSIASNPSEPLLRISAKIVGDFTLSLRDLKIGDEALIQGPYGEFFNKYYVSKKDAVCIAGGIGITPFLSMVKNECSNNNCTRSIYLYYCTKDDKEAHYHNELSCITDNNSQIKYCLYKSSERGRLTAEKIMATLESIKDKTFFLCGPPPMMNSLRSQLLFLGVKHYNIVSEDFSMI